MAFPSELSGDKLYHCSIYYNYFEGHSSDRDHDHQLSYDFLCLLENRLREIGMTKLRYYDNLPPGVNLFDELFSNMLEKAEKIVVLFTKGFQDNHWHKLIHQSNFKELLERKKSKNLLGISLGMSKSDISKDFGMCVHNLVYLADDWRNDDNSWEKIVRFFFEEGIDNEWFQRSTSNVPVQVSDEGTDCIAVFGAAAEVSFETDSHEVGDGGVSDSIEGDEAEGTDSKGQNADGTDSKGQNANGTGSKGQNADAAAEAPTGIKCKQRETIPDDAESQLLDRKNDTGVQVSDEGTDSIEVDGVAAEVSLETDSHEVGEDGVGDSIVVDGADGPYSERLIPDGAAEDPLEKKIQQRKTNSDEDDIPLMHDASISVQESLKEKKNTPGFLGKVWDAYSWLSRYVSFK